jgi:hypothetical protein
MSQVPQGLPSTAQARLAEIKASGTWGSALSTAEFAAIRSVGFVPAGQVFGAAVLSIKNAGSYDCPTYAGATRPATRAPTRNPVVRMAGSSHSSTGNTFWPLVRVLYQARLTAINRMVAECVALAVTRPNSSRSARPLNQYAATMRWSGPPRC